MDRDTITDKQEVKPVLHLTGITAPEVANMWSQYQLDTMARCVYKYMLETVHDHATRDILQQALHVSDEQIKRISEFFKKEGFPIPHGFTDNDVDLSAPQLFTDSLCLTYTYIFTVNGLAGYAAALTTSVRRDIRDYFVKCQEDSMDLFNKALDLLLQKGIVTRPPLLHPPTSYEFVESQDYIKGLLREPRPLNCIEISNIFWDLKKIQLSKAITIAFAQVAKSPRIRKYFWKGVEIYSKHIKIFEELLDENNLPRPTSEEAEVTNSTISPFSDRLMLYHKAVFGSTTMSMYGSAFATCERTDLVADFARLTAELSKHTFEGNKIMIENKWFEQPPLATDREALALQ